MRLKTLELNGFKSFSKKTILDFTDSIVCIVGPNGSGKSNVVEAIRFVLGEQSMKSMRGKAGADLIFKGSKTLPRASHASVSIYFNNSDKVFKLSNELGENVNLNYETVSIAREVFSDGLNKYVLNNSEVRLKDINNLLASVNVGASGHHIISQGEADRILNASSRERREMIEDALGLKIYQYKIKESERKLEKTLANMKEVELLRRENAPHLNFLRKQIEKLEKAREMKTELLFLYREYLKKENIYLENEKSVLVKEKKENSIGFSELSAKISEIEKMNAGGENQKLSTLKQLENEMYKVRGSKSELERKLGRVEGMLESKKTRVEFSNKCPLCGSEIKEVQQNEKRENEEKELAELKISHGNILAEIEKIEVEEKKFTEQIEKLKQEINQEINVLRGKEQELFSLKVKQQEFSSALKLIAVKEENLHREYFAFENEIKEGAVLVGHEILSYKDFVLENLEINRAEQDELRKKIERIKIKLEDSGLSSGMEIKKEFDEVSERDSFLAREMEDLGKSVESLRELMKNLKEKIDFEFKEGIKKINVEFQQFFSIMFGGGHSSLSVVVENKRKKFNENDEEISEPEEDIVFEQGIEINVSLPHKKVKELHALSGGERSLTSIALLFAMSQVNPPPFLVLDETDAALDEANSRKYGDMLEKLSKHSQLVVVTHNRETMSRAGILYGVTVGADGASKLLSVKFDEAAAIAK